MIEILNKQRKRRLPVRKLKRLVAELSLNYWLVNPEITLAFVGNQAIRTLNRKFRRKDKPTDVLSFPIRDFGADGKFYLGDIVIAVPVALARSRQHGQSLEREIEQLVVHGFLHLLGFDHGAGIEDEEENLRRNLIEKNQ